MKTIRTKTLWINADGTEHDSLDAAQAHERYATVLKIIKDADLDWRDGVGEDAATPERIAKLLAPYMTKLAQNKAGIVGRI